MTRWISSFSTLLIPSSFLAKRRSHDSPLHLLFSSKFCEDLQDLSSHSLWLILFGYQLIISIWPKGWKITNLNCIKSFSKSSISFDHCQSYEILSTEFFYRCCFMRVCWIEIDAFFMRMIADTGLICLFDPLDDLIHELPHGHPYRSRP